MRTALETSAVDTAMSDLRSFFGPDGVEVLSRDEGGAWVQIADQPLGRYWLQDNTFVVFHLPSSLPFADIYPLFVRPDLARADGLALNSPITAGHSAGPPEARIEAVQVSRRTRGDASRQSAAHKVEKVLNWMRGQS